MVDSPLLSYLEVWLQGFLLRGLTSGEARHLGPQLVKHDSLEPIPDDSGDIVFYGRAEHIPVDTLLLGDPDEEGLVAKGTDPVLPNPAEEIVKKWSMALDCWFSVAQASRVQALA